MKIVKFKLSSTDMLEDEIIEASFSESEIERLSQFMSYADRVSEASIFSTGIPMINRMSFGPNGLILECDEYNNSQLHELLHVLRPIILEKEYSSFEKIRNLIGQKFPHKMIKIKLKAIKKEYDDGLLSNYLEFKMDNMSLMGDSMLKLWLNGEQYHTDREKQEAWREIENALTLPNTRALLITQIRSKISAIAKLYQIARIIIKPADDKSKESITIP